MEDYLDFFFMEDEGKIARLRRSCDRFDLACSDFYAIYALYSYIVLYSLYCILCISFNTKYIGNCVLVVGLVKGYYFLLMGGQQEDCRPCELQGCPGLKLHPAPWQPAHSPL